MFPGLSHIHFVGLVNVICLSLVVINAENIFHKEFATVYEWARLEYGFPNINYFTKSSIPNDLAVEYRGDNSARTFLTVSRYWSDKVPYTLSIISNRTSHNGPLLMPFPSYRWHSSDGDDDCDLIYSAVRITIDELNRMWVVDSGIAKQVQVCQPKLFVIDLRNDRIVHRYKIPVSQYKTGGSALGSIVVDVDRAGNTMAYIADVLGNGIIVYDMSRRFSWRIQNKLMYPDPNFGTITVGGESFDMMAGIFSMSLTPKNIPGKRYLYFHALSSETENRVPIEVINNGTYWMRNTNGYTSKFTTVGRRGVQCSAEAIDSHGNQYCGITDPPALFSWNIKVQYKPENLRIVSFDRDRFQFISGLKVIRTSNNYEELWALSTRVQKFIRGSVNFKEVNFRIIACEINRHLFDGTIHCRVSANKNSTSLI